MRLTRNEYKRRNQNYSPDDEAKAGDEFRLSSKHTREVNSQMDTEIERVDLINQLTRSMSFHQLAMYLSKTVNRIRLMGTFSAWKSIVNYKEGGIFLDVS